jgi:hypothetical protein
MAGDIAARATVTFTLFPTPFLANGNGPKHIRLCKLPLTEEWQNAKNLLAVFSNRWAQRADS